MEQERLVDEYGNHNVVVYVVIRCPQCGESSGETGPGRGIRIRGTKRPYRYHECAACLHRFKSLEGG